VFNLGPIWCKPNTRGIIWGALLRDNSGSAGREQRVLERRVYRKQGFLHQYKLFGVFLRAPNKRGFTRGISFSKEVSLSCTPQTRKEGTPKQW